MSIPWDVDEDKVFREIADELRRTYGLLVVSIELDEAKVLEGEIALVLQTNKRLLSEWTRRDILRFVKQKAEHYRCQITISILTK